MSSRLLHAWNIVLDILFPPLCAICEETIDHDERADGICAPCLSAIPRYTTFTCPTCRARLAQGKKICHKDTSFRLAAAAPYGEERVKKLVWQLKYEGRAHAARPLARLLLDHVHALTINPGRFIVLPIPLHRARERERGFNQAELLGALLARALSLPLERKALRRIKKTAAQAETKNRRERIKNMAGAFRAREDIVRGKNIFLVDDVYTSGATIEEAVRTLKKAGAKRVVALVAALA